MEAGTIAYVSPHTPRGDGNAVKGNGSDKTEHIGFVVDTSVVTESTVAIILIIIIVGVVWTHPESGEAEGIINLIARYDTGNVVVKDRASHTCGHGKSKSLKTHADTQVSGRDHPVKVGVLGFNVYAISAHTTAGAASLVIALTPMNVANFKLENTLKVFRGDEVYLSTNTLGSDTVVVVTQVF